MSLAGSVHTTQTRLVSIPALSQRSLSVYQSQALAVPRSQAAAFDLRTRARCQTVVVIPTQAWSGAPTSRRSLRCSHEWVQTSHHRCQRQVRGPSAARQQSGRGRGAPPPLPPRCPEPGLPTGGSDAPFFILLTAFPTFPAPPTDITPTFGPVATIAQARQAANTADKILMAT